MSEKKNKKKLEVIDGKTSKDIVPAENVVDVTYELEEFRKVEHMKLKHMMEQVQRIDSFTEIKVSAKEFLNEVPTFEEVIDWLEQGVQTFKSADFLLDKLTVEDVTGDKFVDPYKDLLVAPKDCKNYKDAFRALLVYTWIAPFGADIEKFYYSIKERLGDIEEIVDDA